MNSRPNRIVERSTASPYWFTIIATFLFLTGCSQETPTITEPPSTPSQPGQRSGPTSNAVYATLSAPKQALSVGDTARWTVTVTDTAFNVLPNEPVTWRVDNQAVANVSANGLIRALGVGSTRVTATVSNKLSVNASATLTVGAALRGTGSIYASGLRIPFPGGPDNYDIVRFDAQTGTEKNLTTSGDDEIQPVASPDGQFLVYSLWDGYSVGPAILARNDGTKLLDLGAASGGVCVFFGCPEAWQWLNDGRLEYVYDDFFQHDIRILTPGGSTQIVPWPAGFSGEQMLLSPAGGSLVAFNAIGDLTGVRFSDGHQTALAPDCSFPTTCGSYSWSASGTTLFAARDGAIVSIPLDGTSRRTLYSATSGELSNPSASPDGTTLAFVEEYRLKLIRLADNAVSAIASSPGPIAWSPDSKSIAFGINEEQAVLGLATRVGAINVDGSGLRTYASLSVVKGLSWGK